jgi:cellulose synthase/poly-beta-1,6-N-acetylglucosamine synthase-like glycosyltransferase
MIESQNDIHINFLQFSHAKVPVENMKVSVVIPVYNVIDLIEEVLLRVQAVDLDKEILVINDGSTDGTRDLLKGLAQIQLGLAEANLAQHRFLR